jgi:hypothetical protein
VYFESKQGTNGPRIELIKNENTTPIFTEIDCHIIVGPEPSLFDDWVGSGWLYRDFVKFNYDTLLNSNLAVYGELTFRCSGYFSSQDSIYLGIRELLEPYSTFDTPTGPLIALEQIEVGDTLVSLDIVKHIQRIIDHPDSNFGIAITLSPESFDISRVELVRGSHLLTVGYVEPPEPRW